MNQSLQVKNFEQAKQRKIWMELVNNILKIWSKIVHANVEMKVCTLPKMSIIFWRCLVSVATMFLFICFYVFFLFSKIIHNKSTRNFFTAFALHLNLFLFIGKHRLTREEFS